jgi:hypothetical protein
MVIKAIILLLVAGIMIWRLSAAARKTRRPETSRRIPGPDNKPASQASPEEVSWAHWAQFFTKPEFKAFLDLVTAYFQQRGAEVTMNVKEGTIKIEHDPALLGERYGLHNLAQICRQAKHADWDKVIAHHFDTMIVGQREDQELEQKKGDFDAVAPLIHVKIYPEDYVREIKNFIARQFLEGTVALPVYDLPNALRNVTAEDAKAWGKSEDEIFRLGFANLRKNYPAVIKEHQFQDGSAIKVVSGDHFFVSSHVLLLGSYPELIGPEGSLIGIPHRHILISYPIQDATVIKAVKALIPMIQGMCREGPGPVSDKLYWYHDHKFTNLPYKLDEVQKRMEFIPPQEFVDLLNRVAQKEKPGKDALH